MCSDLFIFLILKVDVPSCFVGLVLEDCTLPVPNHGHVILADPSPILFYPISSSEVRCLVDVPGQKVPSIVNGEMANYLKTVVAPQVLPS
jgi:squalene monooxygenase